MISPEDITGVVLAGGKSSRFGSNKALAILNEHSLLERALNRLKPFCRTSLLSGNYPEYKDYACEQIYDIVPGLGPMGGIYSALKQSETSYVLFLTCDMPYITESLLKRLTENEPPADITVWKQKDGDMQLFPALYASSVLPLVEQHIYSRRLSIRSLLSEVNVCMLAIEANEEDAFLNVNHLNELPNQ